MKNTFINNHDNNNWVLPKTTGEYKYRILSCQVAKFGKKYTCSGAGEHGKLVYTCRVKGDISAFALDYVPLHSVSIKTNNIIIETPRIKSVLINNNGTYDITFQIIPEFCEDPENKYDAFFEEDLHPFHYE